MSPTTLHHTTSESSREFQSRGESQAETVREIQIPEELLDRYVTVALKEARPRQIESGDWYADLPRFSGVWAAAGSPSECLDELKSVLTEWLILKLLDADRDIPVVDDIDLTCLI
jgi:predicted RNase H-like HicB family nuclease